MYVRTYVCKYICMYMCMYVGLRKFIGMYVLWIYMDVCVYVYV